MATDLTYKDFFYKATGYHPYPYQELLASSPTLPQLVDIPTGLGKTAAVVLAWLWRRFGGESISERLHADAPRRLVYCLPMRVLVEQTASNARQWIENLVNADLIPEHRVPNVFVLMGGEIARDWDNWPDRACILIGTQDQIISRALNRGYAMSRFRWPIHFGLLNNDSLWVMDEVQLMGPGLPTTIQLQGFREKMGAYGQPRSIWMSATLTREDFDTIDSPLKGKDWNTICHGLGDDIDTPVVGKRLHAHKILHKCKVILDKKSQKGYAEALASEIRTKHQDSMGLTIVIMNRVRRGQEVASTLVELFKGKRSPPDITLIHSRFRPYERRSLVRILENLSRERNPNHILVATQAIEAGVDISATTLITELAPWSSLVQRFGRLNRYGELEESHAYWVDVQTDPKLAMPYESMDLDLSRDILRQLNDVGPHSLKSLDVPSTGQIHPVVRNKDILELFDTTPDLAGNDMDISPYIRDANNMDVSVFWRTWETDSPPDDLPAPEPDELCPVPLYEIREFMQDKTAWIWDSLESSWQRFDWIRLRPGLVLLFHSNEGGYDPDLGWLGKSASDPVDPIEQRQDRPEEAIGDDPITKTTEYLTITSHSNAVVRELEGMLTSINNDGLPRNDLLLAARWHDRGKAHFVFQNALGDEETGNKLWAKGPYLNHYERPYFRHELASALALILNGEPDLAAYLVAAHHGKVRVSIRSLPGEKIPPEERRFARGVWDWDQLPPVDLGGEVIAPDVTITLELMELGESEEYGPSWLERCLRLLGEHGPFRLAYLESLLRVADWRASSNAEIVDHG